MIYIAADCPSPGLFEIAVGQAILALAGRRLLADNEEVDPDCAEVCGDLGYVCDELAAHRSRRQLTG